MLKWALIVALVALAAPAQAQQQVTTLPLSVTTTVTASTIGITNTFQNVFTATTVGKRSGCLLQKTSGNNDMFVFFGQIQNATTPTSILLRSPSVLRFPCVDFGGGVAPQDGISITGTAGEGFNGFQQ